MSATNIIARIFAGAVTVWSAIDKELTDDFAKVKAALPASAAPDLAAAQSALKQAASDALGALDKGAGAYAPALTMGAEKLADDALAALTGGLSVPLNPLLNGGIEEIVSHAKAALDAWALRAKAAAVDPTSPANHA